ncbi:MAG: hypothetical protein K2X53_05630, partial [Alphaproteobacteria bacterium]|nr:hypothetical protein [Alphaproteobacteria bacterium]
TFATLLIIAHSQDFAFSPIELAQRLFRGENSKAKKPSPLPRAASLSTSFFSVSKVFFLCFERRIIYKLRLCEKKALHLKQLAFPSSFNSIKHATRNTLG